jgi:hypothetical protein
MNDIISFLGGHEQQVPIFGMMKQSGDTLDAYFMNLEIAFDSQHKPEAVRPGWAITHRAIKHQGKKPSRAIGSERSLHWQEGPSRFRIRASWREESLAEEALNSLVQEMSAKPGRKARLLKLAGGVDAAGVMGTDTDRSGVMLTITWHCPASTGGFTRFVLNINSPDPGRPAWPDLMEQQASRLRCK